MLQIKRLAAQTSLVLSGTKAGLFQVEIGLVKQRGCQMPHPHQKFAFFNAIWGLEVGFYA
jgi:hypothetical protein